MLRARVRVWWDWWIGFHWDSGAWNGCTGRMTMRTLNLGFVHAQRTTRRPWHEPTRRELTR